jgi:hypothetical protein
MHDEQLHSGQRRADARRPRPLLDCPTCGLPAEITDRFTLDGAPTRVEHVKLVCVQRHWYALPVDQLPLSAPVAQKRTLRDPSARMTLTSRTTGTCAVPITLLSPVRPLSPVRSIKPESRRGPDQSSRTRDRATTRERPNHRSPNANPRHRSNARAPLIPGAHLPDDQDPRRHP